MLSKQSGKVGLLTKQVDVRFKRQEALLDTIITIDSTIDFHDSEQLHEVHVFYFVDCPSSVRHS